MATMGQSTRHPFDPLSGEEIRKAAQVSRTMFPGRTLDFRAVSLQEPRKEEMLAFLEAQRQQEHGGEKSGGAMLSPPARVARVQLIVKPDAPAAAAPGAGQGEMGGGAGSGTADGQAKSRYMLYELHVDLASETVVTSEHLPGRHSFIDPLYMRQAEKACAQDARVLAEIARLEMPAGSTVVIEPWAYGTDGMNDMAERTTMCYFYARMVENPDANYYAYPLDLCAEVSEDLRVTQVYRLPSGTHDTIKHEGDTRTFDTRKIHPLADSEYHPALRPEPPRTTTKPYIVSQPEGPSFSLTADSNCVEWEKWSFHVGFNYREGLTLHDIRYDSRPIFYRLSLAEMFVPYADPRAPYPRKAAFDLGSDGAGVCANNLQLGCDCLGVIKYFDFHHVTPEGEPLRMDNVVCLHEQDDGILWKHTNPRTGHAVVARARILVLQTIVTVSNYEYVFAFHFSQDAGVSYEVRATGILSTAPLDLDEQEVPPWGTVVAPGVLAPYHQHLFCLRIDPMVDGVANTLVVEESVALPRTSAAQPRPDEGKEQHKVISNPLGVGYVTTSKHIEHEAGLDLDASRNRVFKIVNEAVVNPITRTPVGYKLQPSYSQMLLADPDSFHARRSEFAEHAVWVTRYLDDELWPAGRWTMQSAGGEGIKSVIEARRRAQAKKAGGAGERVEEEEDMTAVRNKDIVVWHTFGSTHNPRIEDWPVMPQERMTVGLKPANFFRGNPAIDVAPATRAGNGSILYSGKEKGGELAGMR
ncbi:copper amine oxidase [Microdochium bolleyi]|uniref:Amine oxidase n=1 Tax=Microdochium bolleyi TaxID=196109 RepID=A0A136IL81_9PEZI|nr:copper amine oxidase [Microdochium bolleyi]